MTLRHPAAIAVTLVAALVASLLAARSASAADEPERYTEQTTAVQIVVPEGWKPNEGRKHFTMQTPDGAATVLVIGMRRFTDARDCLMKLDRDDVMGGLIKTIEPAGEPEARRIGGMDARLFKGRVNIANERKQFSACIITLGEVAYVAFAYADREGMRANQEAIDKVFATLRKRPD